jgi:putative transposase
VVATGVCGDGRREVLGFGVGDSEDGAFWTAFLRSLKARGLAGVQLVIADAHLGLRQAVQATMAGAAIQRLLVSAYTFTCGSAYGLTCRSSRGGFQPLS